MKDYKPNINALIDAARSEGIRLGLEAAKQAIEMNRDEYDAVRLNGIRLGLEAAATTVCRREIEAARELAESGDCHSPTEGRFAGLAEATDLIRALNPETIAKETAR